MNIGWVRSMPRTTMQGSTGGPAKQERSREGDAVIPLFGLYEAQ